MQCPFCNHTEDKVVDSRESREGDSIRRRRECLKCHRRFTSYERLEEMPLMVVKKDGRRENFDRQKLLKSLMLACQKRPVTTTQIDNIVLDAERRVMDRVEREIQSRELGEILMNELKQLDNVAYVRFASVYRDFKDLPDFISALEDVLTQRDREVEPSKVKVLQPKQSTPPIERSLFSTDDMKKRNEGTGL